MTRVSENSSLHAINYSLGKAKTKLEDLQIKGSNLKRIQKPSDDPISNIDLLAIRSQQVDNGQFLRNSSFAKTQLDFTEAAIADLTEVMAKAKEIAIGQASDVYNGDVRQSIAKEVAQLKNQAIAIANRRVGNRYIFAGHKTLTQPFDGKGNYYGDDGKISIEVNKDFFIPINLTGLEIFFNPNTSTRNFPNAPIEEDINKRELASLNNTQSTDVFDEVIADSIFDHLTSLENALLTNNPDIIQGLLEEFDTDYERLVTLRTEVGSLLNSIANAESNIENNKVINETYKTRLEDADVAELFSDLSRQQNVLNASYKSGANLINRSLIDFVR
jgi:flagellar hook-associated protein 3 FlgL